MGLALLLAVPGTRPHRGFLDFTECFAALSHCRFVCHSSDRTMLSEFICFCLSNSLCDQFPFFFFLVNLRDCTLSSTVSQLHTLPISARRTSLIRFIFAGCGPLRSCPLGLASDHCWKTLLGCVIVIVIVAREGLRHPDWQGFRLHFTLTQWHV